MNKEESILNNLNQSETLLLEIIDKLSTQELETIEKNLKEIKTLLEENFNQEKIAELAKRVHDIIIKKSETIMQQNQINDIRGLVIETEKEQGENKLIEIKNEIKSMVESMLRIINLQRKKEEEQK